MADKEEASAARRSFTRPSAYLMAAVAATAANLALWAAGFHYTIVTGMLVGAACAGVVCWRQGLAEERMLRKMAQLVELVLAQRVVYLPQQSKVQAVRQVESEAGLTPESIAAARALARRIADVEMHER